ncbi:glycerol-3-phosphate dehydrogenase/oxidase [Aromatoleum sp.]|uniref:glycerol-3-phosphate dehydrogenase/oxidase n=1 Tax=Aromatoleum sp. TaxID=2307007 RepID=UPI002FCB58E4
MKSALAREALLARLHEQHRWDIIVIGGGATGLGCAVDAAARGYSTLLLEAHDFAKGTSSRATKLIHGGVRYLAQGNFPLVREALAERSLLLANAPHLVHPLRFVVPAYRWHERPLFGAGLAMYDLLAGSHGLERSRQLGTRATLAALPNAKADGLKGGIAYWDAQFDDARLAIALMATLFDLGGLALNYLPVEGLVTDAGRIVGVRVRDAESGKTLRLDARVLINATGVWADAVRRFECPAAESLLHPSQGAHVVVDRRFLPGDDALLVPRTPDGRVLFVIPWQGRVLIGTTDLARSDLPLEPKPLAGEVDFILATAARYLARAPARSDVRSVFVGLRPLIHRRGGLATRRLSREHFIEVSPGGLVTITGGKWTTYRRMAEDAIDVARSVAGLPARECPTARLPLHGATAGFSRDPYGCEREAVNALPGARRMLQDGSSLTEAEVRHAVRNELARTVEDVLARRHRMLFLDAALASAAAPGVAAILAEELGRDDDWQGAEVARFRSLTMQYAAVPENGGRV